MNFPIFCMIPSCYLLISSCTIRQLGITCPQFCQWTILPVRNVKCRYKKYLLSRIVITQFHKRDAKYFWSVTQNLLSYMLLFKKCVLIHILIMMQTQHLLVINNIFFTKNVIQPFFINGLIPHPLYIFNSAQSFLLLPAPPPLPLLATYIYIVYNSSILVP